MPWVLKSFTFPPVAPSLMGKLCACWFIAGLTTVTMAEPDAAESAWATAVTETVAGLGIEAGAVYSPVAEIVPTVLLPAATPATLQFTAVVLVPVTVAVNCRILFVATSAVGGETLTVIGAALWELPPPHDKSSNKQLNASELRGREKVCQTFAVTASTPALLVQGSKRLIALL